MQIADEMLDSKRALIAKNVKAFQEMVFRPAISLLFQLAPPYGTTKITQITNRQLDRVVLRCFPAKEVGSARVSSNLTVVGFFFCGFLPLIAAALK